METAQDLFGLAALLMEAAGVATIVAGAVWATWRVHGRRGTADAYGSYRRDLGRAIILGLEFLIAGDIIRTVAVSHTLASVAVLGVIILIRAFLSFTLEAEVEGRWPWQRPPPGTR